MIFGALVLSGGMFALGRAQRPSPEPAAASPDAKEAVEHGHESGAESIHFSAEALKSAGVRVETVSLRPQILGLPFNGTIELSPTRVARVASVVSGRVIRLNVGIDQKVSKGQTLALVESRSVGEAQTAFQQAAARLKNAESNYAVVGQQIAAGVFSKTPLENARRSYFEAIADRNGAETANRTAQTNLENASRLASSGSFSNPPLEAARGGFATAQEAEDSAKAALQKARSEVRSAQLELSRRQQIASGGGYSTRQIDEARRALVAAQSAKLISQSEVSTAKADLARAKALANEGLISTRDLQKAQTTFDAAEARLESAGSEERAASNEYDRQQKLASTGVAAQAAIEEGQSLLVAAQSDVRSRSAQVTKAQGARQIAESVLKREQSLYRGGLANKRELSQARAQLDNSRTTLEKAVKAVSLTRVTLEREEKIFKSHLNDRSQREAARAILVTAKADLDSARTTLRLLQSSPGGSAVVPLRSPLSGIVQVCDVAQGESIEADKNLFTVANLDVIHVDMFLPEREISRVRLGSPVEIRVDALPGRSFAGTIELVHSELDPKTRTVEAHAELRNPGDLRPGMFARGVISTGSSSLGITVPTDSIQDFEGKKVVFVQGNASSEFTAREVDTGVSSNRKTFVKSGLKAGDKIVIQGAFMVKAQAMKAELGHED